MPIVSSRLAAVVSTALVAVVLAVGTGATRTTSGTAAEAAPPSEHQVLVQAVVTTEQDDHGLDLAAPAVLTDGPAPFVADDRAASPVRYVGGSGPAAVQRGPPGR